MGAALSGGPLPGLRLSPSVKDGEHVGVRIDAEGFGNALERFRLAPGQASLEALERLGTDTDSDGQVWAPDSRVQAEQLSGCRRLG